MQNKKPAQKEKPKAKEQPADTKNKDATSKEQKQVVQPQKTENSILAKILQRHGISKEAEEAGRKEEVDNLRKSINESGLKVAFELILNEIVSKNIPKEDLYAYTRERMIEIGKKYKDFQNKENKGKPEEAKAQKTKK